MVFQKSQVDGGLVSPPVELADSTEIKVESMDDSQIVFSMPQLDGEMGDPSDDEDDKDDKKETEEKKDEEKMETDAPASEEKEPEKEKETEKAKEPEKSAEDAFPFLSQTASSTC